MLREQHPFVVAMTSYASYEQHIFLMNMSLMRKQTYLLDMDKTFLSIPQSSKSVNWLCLFISLYIIIIIIMLTC